MKRFLVFQFILLTVFMTGCLGKQLPYEDIQPEAGKAVVYVYRPTSFINSSETMILEVNGDEQGSLSHGFHLYSFVPPGDCVLVLKKNVIPFNEYGRISLSDIQAGQVYYVKADPVPLGGFDMILMDEDQGRKEAMETKYFVKE